jgi:hypothetical protein
MQAVIRPMSGISELHRRNASPVDCRFSGECKARARQRGQGGRDSQDRGDLIDGFGVNDGHLKPFELTLKSAAVVEAVPWTMDFGQTVR